MVVTRRAASDRPGGGKACERRRDLAGVKLQCDTAATDCLSHVKLYSYSFVKLRLAQLAFLQGDCNQPTTNRDREQPAPKVQKAVVPNSSASRRKMREQQTEQLFGDVVTISDEYGQRVEHSHGHGKGSSKAQDTCKRHRPC